MAERPLVVFVSDIHLTDALHGQAVPKKDVFERFGLVFFPDGDPTGRDYEWWSGAMVGSAISGRTGD